MATLVLATSIEICWKRMAVSAVLMDEKDREDAVRALPEVRGFARWGWDVALDVRHLGPVLARAGVVPLGSRRRATPSSAGECDGPQSTKSPVPAPGGYAR